MVKIVCKNYSTGRFFGVLFREGVWQGVHVGIAVVSEEAAKPFEGLAGFECSPASETDIETWAEKEPVAAPATVDLASYQAEIAELKAEREKLKAENEGLKRQVASLDSQKSELENALKTELGKVSSLEAEVAELKAKKK